MEAWRKVWQEGISPLLTHDALRVLRRAVADDDPKLIQGAITTPPPLDCVGDWPVQGACAVGYCGWKGHELDSVKEVEEFFARMCMEIDVRLGEPASCRWFYNWFDETPRENMRFLLLPEIDLALAKLAARQAAGAA